MPLLNIKDEKSMKNINLNNNEKLVFINPVIHYDNRDTNKLKILKLNKGKSGIYIWVNLNNNKSYVGSAIDLSNRLKRYYSISFLEREIIKSKIYRALLKHGYSNFSLDILEYCKIDVLREREQYYLDTLKPSYNI
jgi:hypothetical protein